MKKIIIVMLSIILMISLVACKNRPGNPGEVDQGKLLIQREEYEKAEKFYQERIEKDDKNPDNYLNLAELYFLLNKRDLEMETLVAGMEKGVDADGRIKNKLLEIYYEEEEYEEVERILLDLWDGEKEEALYSSLSDLYYKHMGGDRFIDLYEKFNEEFDNKENIIRRASLYLDSDDRDLAYREMDKLEYDTSNIDLVIQEMNFYDELDDGEKILELIEENTRDNKSGSVYSAYRYWYYSLRGRYFIKDILPIDLDGDGIMENLTLYINNSNEEDASEYMLIIQDGISDQVYDRFIQDKDFKGINLSGDMQGDEFTAYIYGLEDGGKINLKELIRFDDKRIQRIDLDFEEDISLELKDDYKISIASKDGKFKEVIGIPKIDLLLYNQGGYYTGDGRSLDRPLENLSQDFIVSKEDNKFFSYINIHLLTNPKIELVNILSKYELNEDNRLELIGMETFQPDYFTKE